MNSMFDRPVVASLRDQTQIAQQPKRKKNKIKLKKYETVAAAATSTNVCSALVHDLCRRDRSMCIHKFINM